MVKSKNFLKYFGIAAICAGLTACGGGGSDSGGSDPIAQPTVPGPGSSTPSAEVTGTIQYAQYQASNVAMGAPGFVTTPVTASTVYNPTSKVGTIQFAVMGGSEVISTTDGYANSTWTGPLMSGSYLYEGNILMGCNAAASDNESTQVFVSSSLTRLKDGAIDDLNGKTFDLMDCALKRQAMSASLTVSADGALTLSNANYTFPKNEVFNMLNPEKYSGALINTTDAKTRGNYAGHAYRFTVNGVSKYAIVLQTNANSFGDANRYHYMVAVQR